MRHYVLFGQIKPDARVNIEMTTVCLFELYLLYIIQVTVDLFIGLFLVLAYM